MFDRDYYKNPTNMVYKVSISASSPLAASARFLRFLRDLFVGLVLCGALTIQGGFFGDYSEYFPKIDGKSNVRTGNYDL